MVLDEKLRIPEFEEPVSRDRFRMLELEDMPAQEHSPEDTTATQSPDNLRKPARISNPESYILLPAKTHGTYSYPDILISIDKVHLGKNWTQCHEALLAEDSYMLTIREYIDFLRMLKSGKAHNGKGNKIDTARINAILDDILAVRDPYRAEWLDADFKVENGKICIKYNHRLARGVLKPQNSEPLETCLMEDCYIDIGSCNRQGLPTRKSTKKEIYYWKPLDDNNSVAWFEADSDRVRLSCSWNPQVSDAGLGVRRAKIF